MKIKNTAPTGSFTSTNLIKYVGEIPDCISSDNCAVDTSNLTYLISLLLQRYCEVNNVLNEDLSTIDLTCIISANPDIEIPEEVTLETLLTHYKDNICALYSQISDLQDTVNSLVGLTCLNDYIQISTNETIEIDPLFNDIITEVSGTVVVTILQEPINGTTTIASNVITYTPNLDYDGNEVIIYKVTKGSYSCTAKISIVVKDVITETDIETICAEQIVTLLQSDSYWDIGIPIGTKMSVTASNLTYFNLIGGAWGKGSGRWAKWAICNGNNSTDDEKGQTTRGYDVNDANYDDASASNTNGADTVSLIATNIPKHRHGQVYVLRDENTVPSQFGATVQSPTTYATNEADDSGAEDCKFVLTNTGDGTDNVGGQDVLPTSVTAVNIKNKYFTEIKIQKIL